MNANDEIKKKIKEFYEESDTVWPEEDQWHKVNQRMIYRYLHSLNFPNSAKVLNAGSGGNDYQLVCNMYHLDVAANKIENMTNARVGSVEAMPYNNEEFDITICVGSILNYCDPVSAINELSRTLKAGGQLVLEFETSYSYEYFATETYKKNVAIANTMYFDKPHKMWVYSFNYITQLLSQNSFRVDNTVRFHILSSLAYKFYKNENKASQYVIFDKVLQYVPFIKNHAANIIFRCTKV